MRIKSFGRTNRYRRLALLALLTSSACIAPTAAFAQDVASSDESADAAGAGEIIVTAQKRSQSTQKVPLSITAASGEQLSSLGIEEIRDITKIVPGFTVAQSFRGPPIYTLRGVGFNTPNMSTSSPVGVYQDEIAYPYPIMTTGMAFDLERVEVLKGPQGTLYGRNTTGGLVNSIARKPTDELDGYLRLNVGSYETYGVEGAIGGPITEGINSRLSFNVERSDKGWQQHRVTGDRLGKVDRVGARLAFDIRPSDGIKLLLTGNWTRDRSDTMAGQSIFTYAKGLAAAGIPENLWEPVGVSLGLPSAFFHQAFTPTSASQAQWATTQPPWGGTVGGRNFNPSPIGQLRKDNELKSISLRGEFDLSSSIKLTTLTSYSDFSRDETVDAAGINLEAAVSRQIGYIKSFSQEVRLSGESDSFNWIVGGFIARDKTSETDKNWGAYVTDIVPLRALGSAFMPVGSTQAQIEDVLWGFRDWQNEARQRITTKAVFAQADWEVVPDLTITAGVRYTNDKTDFEGCSRDQGDNAIAATWKAFFVNYLGIPSNVGRGGCVTYQNDLKPFLLPNPSFVPLAVPTAFLVNAAAGPFPQQGIINKTLKESNVSGRLGINYQANPSTMVYGYYARGFKSGAFPNVSANVASQYNAAQQEEINAFEIGVKSRPGAGVTLNASAFYYDYKNKQVYGYVPDIVFGTLNRIVNIPKSRILGAEVEAAFPLAKGLDFRASATYLDTKINEYVGFDDFGRPQNFKGASFTFTPKFQASGILSYETELSSNWDARITLDGRYSSKGHADLLQDPRFDIKSYFLIDGNVEFIKDNKINVSLFVKNLTNKYYWSSAQYYEDNLVRYAGMPRTWGLAFRYGF